MWGRLVNVTEEMWSTVVRTAFSLTISEAQDFACELLDENGDKLVHSPRAMPVFNLTLPAAVKGMLKIYPREKPAAGRRADQQRSVAVRRAPVRRGDRDADLPRRRGWSPSPARSATSRTSAGRRTSLNVREIYDEGLQIPPLKLYGRASRTRT